MGRSPRAGSWQTTTGHITWQRTGREAGIASFKAISSAPVASTLGVRTVTALFGTVVVAIIIGFIWLCVRDMKESKEAVAHLTEARGLKADETFHCTPSGNLLLDFSGRKVGLANVSFPTHSSQNPPSFNASTVIPFQDIIKTSAHAAKEGTMVHVHFALARPNLINSDDYIAVYVHIHDKQDMEKLSKALKYAGLLPEQAQIA